MTVSSLPIGVFDSGIGGLTVLRALRRRLPQEAMIYLGDTARLPYGTKSASTVERYAVHATDHLVALGIKLLVVACNTASAHALPALRRRHPALSIVGVIEPSAAAACRASSSGRIGVIATEGTIAAGAYDRAISRLRPEANVRSNACSLLVALAEEGWVDDSIAEVVIRRYLAPLFAPADPLAPDCLVLGCTHFPLFSDSIAKVVGPTVALIDSGIAVAGVVAQMLAARRLVAPAANPSLRLLATDSCDRFAKLAASLLDMRLPANIVELVEIGASEPEEPLHRAARAAL